MKVQVVFLISIIANALFEVSGQQSQNRILMCYFISWSIYRDEPFKFSTDKIDPKLCTHIIYAYAGINGTTDEVVSTDPWTDFEKDGGNGNMVKLAKLKEINPDLKILASIGGWSEGSENFSQLSDSNSRRRVFIKSVLDFIWEHELDGVDINWMFPGFADQKGKPSDKGNFPILLAELKEALKRRKMLLTAHIVGRTWIADNGYEIKAISDAVDYLLVRAYDYDGPWGKITKPISPLYNEEGKDESAEFTINYVLNNGADPTKLIMGFGTHGYEYALNEKVIGDKYFGIPADTLLPDQGFVGYNKVCYKIFSEDNPIWEEKWDSFSRTPVVIREKRLITYENERSIKEKLKLLPKYKLAGAFVMSLDTDDFNGNCSQSNYPLIRAIDDYLTKLNKKRFTVEVTNEKYEGGLIEVIFKDSRSVS